MFLPYIDLHCDTLMLAWLKKQNDAFEIGSSMADVRKLAAGGCRAQLFAIFLPPGESLKKHDASLSDEAYIGALHGIFENTVSKHGDVLAKALNAAEIEKNASEGKLSAILSMEDCRAVEGNFENIKRFYDMGVRVMGLTWNLPNCFGVSNSPDPAVMNAGLTDFGKEAVPYMQSLGMIPDVSHLSDGGFWDVARFSTKPFIASHSNCRALNPHPRSLTDEMIRALADRGGVMGVNFYGAFLGKDTESTLSTVDGIAAQLRHRINVGGIECAAIGTDFDGIDGELEIPDASAMPRLFDELAKRGFTAYELEHIAYKNAERVFREVMR